MPSADPIVVVGAGVVGLSVAEALSRVGAEVIVVERHSGPGRETSSRNSGVIHAGLYDEPGSLKARLCVSGRRLLYAFCDQTGVPYRRCGKLVVACNEAEVAQLRTLARRGHSNGVAQIRLLDANDVTRLEPAVRAKAALHCPDSGIVDSHALTKVLEAQARASGATLLYRCDPRRAQLGRHGWQVRLGNPSGEEQLRARAVVNCAGLAADDVSARAGLGGYRLHWCKGQYFAVTGAASRIVSRLIYPVPLPRMKGLGIHATPDLAGGLRLGPDATYVPRDVVGYDYEVNLAQAPTFHAAAARFLPELPLSSLQPDSAGLRPKLQGPGDPWRDFIIRDEADRGCAGLINLIGIESPGLTAALAIAQEVRALLA